MHSSTAAGINHIWRIPQWSPNELDYLFNGYIRNNVLCYIPKDIIILCIHYFSDLNQLNEFKNELISKSANKKSFRSNIFCINSIKSYIECKPFVNGEDVIEFIVFVPCLPSTICKLIFDATLKIPQLKIE
eukprot:279869_1